MAVDAPVGVLHGFASEPPAGGAAAEVAGADSAAAAPAFPAPRVRAWQVGLVRPDRLQHLGFSLTLAVAGTIVFRDRAAGGGVAFALGVAKELYDSRHGGADVGDLMADATGVALGLAAVRPRDGGH